PFLRRPVLERPLRPGRRRRARRRAGGHRPGGGGGGGGGRVVPSSVGGVRAMTGELPHLNPEGEVHKLDLGGKDVTVRRVTPEARVRRAPGLTERLFAGVPPKGDALTTVRIGGIMASKKTPDLIPLAHPIGLDSVEVRV